MAWQVKPQNTDRNAVVILANIMNGTGIDVRYMIVHKIHGLYVVTMMAIVRNLWRRKMLSKEEKLEILYEMYDDLCSLSEDVKADALESAIRAYATKLEIKNKDDFQLKWEIKDLTDKEKEAIKRCIDGTTLSVMPSLPNSGKIRDCATCKHYNIEDKDIPFCDILDKGGAECMYRDMWESKS